MFGLASRQILIILIFAFIGWAACGATMGIGMSLTTIDAALIIHAIGAPVYFIIVSLVYFKRFNYTTPLTTGAIFISFVVIVDFFLVALAINRNLDMFRSFLGTWLPFILIFSATWVMGRVTARGSSDR